MKTLATAALAWYLIFTLGVAAFGALGFVNELALVVLLTMATAGAVLTAVAVPTNRRPPYRM